MAGILWLVQWITMVFVPSKNVLKTMSFSLAKIRPKFVEDVGPFSDYIPRLDIEKQISHVFEKRSLKSGTFFVMYGPKGAGKSSSVARALGDKEGVIKLLITQGDTTSSILENIVELCGLKPSKTPKVRLDDLSYVLRSAAKRRKGHPVTVVFEVERGCSSPEVLSLVRQVSKHFALDANVLIILSEANAVLGFGDDQRQEFIWVNEMSHDEALEYVKKRVPSISAEDFNRFVDNIGTLPLSLSRLCDALLGGQKMDDFIRRALASAKVDLVAFLHQPILTALKKSPKNVGIESFSGVEHKGIPLSEPKLVAPAMKLRNAIVFDFEEGQYKLFSKAHQTALKTYDPPRI